MTVFEIVNFYGGSFFTEGNWFFDIIEFLRVFQCPLLNVELGLAFFSWNWIFGSLEFHVFKFTPITSLVFEVRISQIPSTKFSQESDNPHARNKKKITCCRITLSLFIYLLKHNKIVIKYNMNKFNVDSGIWHIFALKFPFIKFTPAFLGKMYFVSWS